MALISEQYDSFKQSILRAAMELQSRELVYTTEWYFDFPSHRLTVDGELIEREYQIPTGWYGYGEAELDRLVTEGVLTKTEEHLGDPLFLEKKVVYQVNGLS